MDESIAQAGLAFALTYLMHSTLVAVGVLIVLRFTTAPRFDLRLRLLKAALIVPVCTSVAASLIAVPHFGWQWACWSETEVDSAVIASAPEQSPIDFDSSTEREYGPAAAVISHQAATRTEADSAADQSHRLSWTQLAILSLLTMVTVRLLALLRQCFGLRSLRRRSVQITEPRPQHILQRLVQQLRLKRSVSVRACREKLGPLTAGIRNPFVLVPRSFYNRLSIAEYEAMLAHELVHIRHADAAWRLAGRIICSVFFFQPLNARLLKLMEVEAEFLADQRAAKLIQHPHALANCLTTLGDWLAERPRDPRITNPVLTVGMASFRSTLGRRIESILDDTPQDRVRWARTLSAIAVVVITVAVLLTAPRALARFPDHPSEERTESMKSSATTLTMLAALAMPVAADETAEPKHQPKPLTKTTADDLPEGAHRFNGVLVGRLASKDVEKGSFVINVDVVPRVWRNSRAEAPKQMVGRNIRVNGVTGRWLDVLLLVRDGETLETEARHDEGNQLTFPGELLRKVAPYQPGDYPTLPEAFRGFRGAVRATVEEKDPELFEMIVKVDRVLEAGENSDAEDPDSIAGKRMMLAGFWQRKEQYHALKAGDVIDVGIHHIGRQSDHVSIDRFVRKSDGKNVSEKSDRTSKDSKPKKTAAADGETRMQPQMKAASGFKGVIVGRLVNKDVEKGTFTLTVDRVPRVWKNNQSDQPKQLLGKQVQAGGLTGQHLDTLLVTREGETLEFGAFGEEGGEYFRVVELFRKVAPVKDTDYPELPEAFRGFQGEIVATVVQKDPQLYSLTVKVLDIIRPWEKSAAADAEQAVGETITLSGFWRRKDEYHELEVGHKLRLGLRHTVRASDSVDVAEQIKVLP